MEVNKMSQVDVNRSVHFVSLDTHPANNALVVSYEISVAAFDRSSGEELRRGSKRHQFQIRISALDELKEEHLSSAAGGSLINLEAVSRDILTKCKLLEPHQLEEIHLHLLYLVNRRRAQVAVSLHSTSRESSARIASSRPSSRLSHRVSRLSAGSIRTMDPPIIGGDVYMNYLAQEEQSTGSEEDRLIGSLLVELDSHLQRGSEAGAKPGSAPGPLTESQIEAIYGDEQERRQALTSIRRLCSDDTSFAKVSRHRLLVCALLRALQAEAESGPTQLGILFCLIRYTMFADVFVALSGPGEPVIDVAKPILDQLRLQVAKLVAAEPLSECQCLLINSLLVIVMNLLRLSRQEPRLICPQLSVVFAATTESQSAAAEDVQHPTSTLINLFTWLARSLERDLRLSEGSARATLGPLGATVRLLLQLSAFKEFLGQIRAQSDEQFIDSLASLLNTLQVNRPQSAPPASHRPAAPVVVVASHHELFRLELSLLGLVNNLLLERQLKWRLMRRKLLVKCVLRSLAMFMAARVSQQSLIGHFSGSSVLIRPTRILYELSCEPRMLAQLYRSKLIIKCLLEYLVGAVSDSSQLTRVDGGGGGGRQDVTEDARSYIVALWINLASRREAPIYSEESRELRELLAEYTHLAVAFIEKQVAPHETIQLPVYLHSKLLRVVTHFISCTDAKPPVQGWIESLARSAKLLVHFRSCRQQPASGATVCYAHPLLVECVGSLSNLVEKAGIRVEPLPVANELVTELFALLSPDSKEPQSERDDLLLASIVLVGQLARFTEICAKTDHKQQATAASSFWLPFEATCNALESKPVDREMLVCALYALQQLMRHSGFLNQLWPPPQDEQLNAPTTAALQVSRKLAGFLLTGDKQLSGLSVSLLEQINQLELRRRAQQESESEAEQLRLTRFEAYNEKWVSTIGASRRPDLGSGSLRDRQLEWPSSEANYSEDEGQEEEEEDYELSHLRALALDAGQEQSNAEDDQDDHHHHQAEDSDSELEAAGQEEPDMNVIDANSMIKHLTARRELRFSRDSV